MKNVSTLFIALSLGLAACGGDDGGSDGTETATPSTMTSPTGTAGDDDGTPTSTAGDDDGTPTSTAGDDDGMDDGMMTGTDGGTADSNGGGGGAGFCNETCKAPTDCAAGTGTEETYACTDGFCEFIGEIVCDPATCDDLGIGVCGSIDGIEQCTFPCPNGDECTAPLTCTGMDDEGNAVCVAEVEPCTEGEPCDTAGGQFGTCTDGVCSCSENTECTAPGYGCDPG